MQKALDLTTTHFTIYMDLAGVVLKWKRMFRQK